MERETTTVQEDSVQVDGIGGLDQIREIIVGDDLRSIQAALKNIQEQINDLNSTLGSFKDEADAFNDNFQASTSSEFEKAKQSAEEKQKNIEVSMGSMMKTIKAQLKKLEANKVDKSKIGQVFMEWGQKINEMQS